MDEREIRKVVNSKEDVIATLEHYPGRQDVPEGGFLVAHPSGKPVRLYKKLKGMLWWLNFTRDGNEVVDKNLIVGGKLTVKKGISIDGNIDLGYSDTILIGYALKGSLPSPAYLLGINSAIFTGQTATDSTERAMGNNHLCIRVNTITGSGVITVTGDLISESDGTVTLGVTEDITVDATGDYQTDKKWWIITGIVIPGGISAINYDIVRLGYWDHSNEDFRIIGYRVEITPTNVTQADFRLQIYKVQDDGNKKVTIVTMEDISISGTTAWITDTKRSARDYSNAGSTQFRVGMPSVLKMTDFDTYFSSDENKLEGEFKNEGIIIKIIWDNIDFIDGVLFYKHGVN